MIVQNLTEWKMSGFWPYTPIQGNSMETGGELAGVTGLIDAKVPGSVYADLIRAGMIEDPYFEMNSLKCEWVSQRWWVYTTSFTADGGLRGKRLYLNFKGIDYRACVYFNNRQVAEHDNMYTPCRVDITDSVSFDGDNLVRVMLESAPDEMGQIGYTSRTFTQKARFTYKWDFGTRMIALGLWDAVTLECDGGCAIGDTHVRYIDGKLSVEAETDGGVLAAKLSYNGAAVASGETECGKLELEITQPELWYPNGYGEQPLYDLELTLTAGGVLSDTKRMRVGLRTLAYERCEGAVESALPYIPVINGRKIYIKGVNCTPFDMMYGCVDGERYDALLSLAKAANVNLIRVWGGGVIEKEEFYELCDKYGIMVWQEFIQSSSGIDNTPSERPEFLANIAKTAEHAVKLKRNHVSLTYWSGGNELFEFSGEPATYKNKNIAMLKEIANRLDPDRLMLPTSASGPIGWQDNSRPEDNQDIHGPWKYAGAEGHYTLYNNSPIQLHSEFGADGMSNLSSLRTFLSPANLKVDTMANNLVWRHHGEWWDTYWRDSDLFGVITDLSLFCDVSQFIQAEGIRYALEANRRRAFRNCGSIVWQFNEPWPNVSCTCLVDYYAQPKFAYYFYRDAMKSLHVSMRYDKLIWSAGETFRGSLFVHDDNGEGYDRVEVNILDDKKQSLKRLCGDKPFDFTWEIAGAERTFYVECTLYSGEKTDRNLYMYFITGEANPKADPQAVRDYIRNYRK